MSYKVTNAFTIFGADLVDHVFGNQANMEIDDRVLSCCRFSNGNQIAKVALSSPRRESSRRWAELYKFDRFIHLISIALQSPHLGHQNNIVLCSPWCFDFKLYTSRGLLCDIPGGKL